MSLRTTLAALLATALLGCPLPQPLPDYPPGTITPPRILAASTTWAGQSFVPVPANCTGAAPVFDLDARVFYQDSVTVEARWFVDYEGGNANRRLIQNAIREVPAGPDPLVFERAVPPFRFQPYDYAPPAELGLGADGRAAGVVHLVELVVSNGFDPHPEVPQPNRTPAVTELGARFEVQTHRWVFVNVDGLPCP